MTDIEMALLACITALAATLVHDGKLDQLGYELRLTIALHGAGASGNEVFATVLESHMHELRLLTGHGGGSSPTADALS